MERGRGQEQGGEKSAHWGGNWPITTGHLPQVNAGPVQVFSVGNLRIVPYNLSISWEKFRIWNRGGSGAVTLGMTTSNSLVFFFLGVAMVFAPAELPQFFPANAGDGSCTSALWLGVMGVAQALLGLTAALFNETARVRAAIERWDPIGQTFNQPDVQWVAPASLYVVAGKKYAMARSGYAMAGKTYAVTSNSMAASEMAA